MSKLTVEILEKIGIILGAILVTGVLAHYLNFNDTAVTLFCAGILLLCFSMRSKQRDDAVK